MKESTKCKVFVSKKTDDWKTPIYIYNQVKELGLFDPCPFQSSFDGLDIEWGRTNFVNPPYSKLKEWVEKAIEQHKKGRKVIMLIPARTDTKAFERIFKYGSEITFITGRLRFNESNPAPFPSMLVKLTGDRFTLCRVMKREDINIKEL